MWLWGCLTPHPPIIIPSVGRGDETEASRTIESMELLSDTLSRDKLDNLFVLSPHAPYDKALHFTLAKSYSGSMSMFGVPQEKLELAGDPKGGKDLVEYLSTTIKSTFRFSERATIDHGSFVPLYFFGKKFSFLPSIVIANPVGLTYREAYNGGVALRKFYDERTWALLASGDLSHSLKPGGPAGYHPDGVKLDELIVDAIKNNDPSGLLGLSEIFINNAAECGVRSVLFLLGLFSDRVIDILSYEGPFGVGYCVAGTKDMKNSDKVVQRSFKKENLYTRLARRSIAQKLEKGTNLQLSEMEDDLKDPHACFVSLKSADGKLRGCIGTIYPVYPVLAEEIIANAVSAATKDPRFPPVSLEELENIVISVDVLSEPEKIGSPEELNPVIYGVIVSLGNRRGVLLPDLEGIDTPEEQIEIACSKAGIRDVSDAKIYRFTVDRYSELSDRL